MKTFLALALAFGLAVPAFADKEAKKPAKPGAEKQATEKNDKALAEKIVKKEAAAKEIAKKEQPQKEPVKKPGHGDFKKDPAKAPDVTAIFKKLDANGDGQLSLAEFTSEHKFAKSDDKGHLKAQAKKEAAKKEVKKEAGKKEFASGKKNVKEQKPAAKDGEPKKERKPQPEKKKPESK